MILSTALWRPTSSRATIGEPRFVEESGGMESAGGFEDALACRMRSGNE